MKTLEENRYKKVYNSDARRVAWMVNNEGVDLQEMPNSMRKKWTKAAYGRERYLATEFLKSKSEQMTEGNIGITTKKGKTIELTHKTSGKEIVVVNNPSVLKKYKKLGYLISMPEQMYESKVRETIRKILEAKIVRYEIPTKDKKKVQALVKKLKLKDTKDYAIYGSGKTFEMELDSKHANKVLELLMKMNIKVRG
jgi:hypothetical protein